MPSQQTRRDRRGMVTFELAVGILTASLLAGLLGWGMALVGLQARCTDLASQVARQLGRGDLPAAAQAQARVPDGGQVLVNESDQQIEVMIVVEASWGVLGPVKISGRAVAPTGGR